MIAKAKRMQGYTRIILQYLRFRHAMWRFTESAVEMHSVLMRWSYIQRKFDISLAFSEYISDSEQIYAF